MSEPLNFRYVCGKIFRNRFPSWQQMPWINHNFCSANPKCHFITSILHIPLLNLRSDLSYHTKTEFCSPKMSMLWSHHKIVHRWISIHCPKVQKINSNRSDYFQKNHQTTSKEDQKVRPSMFLFLSLYIIKHLNFCRNKITCIWRY